MATQIKLRRDTYQNWFDNNPVLAEGEPAFDLTNKKLKIGDGTTTWRLLAYFDDKETVLSAVSQDILPSVDSNGTTGYTLGSPTKKWKELFVSNGSIYIGDVKLSNVAGKLVATKVVNPGEENEVPDPEDSEADSGIKTVSKLINNDHEFALTSTGTLTLDGDPFTGSGGGGAGVVNRSVVFPGGQAGDTAGTLANDSGTLYYSTGNWTDVNDINKVFEVETTQNNDVDQSGGLFHSIRILAADYPGIKNILDTLNNTNTDYQTDFTVDGGPAFGGAQTVTQVSYNGTTIDFLWSHRTGVDPETIEEGDSFTVEYTGSIPQPAIWTRILSSDISVEIYPDSSTELTVADKDFNIRTTRNNPGQDADIGIYAADDLWLEAAGDDVVISAADEVRINSNNENNSYQWRFDATGRLQLPENGDIVDSDGNSVLGGTAGDANIWIQDFETTQGAPADVVGMASSVEYLDNGDIIALFVHYTDDGQNESRYSSIGRFTPTGTKQWSMSFQGSQYTDGWGLAVDNVNSFIYVAGQSDGVGPHVVATLTKLAQADGAIMWSKYYDVGYDNTNAVVDVASDGNPIVVGYAHNGTDNQIVTTKISAVNGSIIWSKALNGQGSDQAYGMAVGPSGEVVTVGYMDKVGVTDGAATLYTEPASNPNWGTNLYTETQTEYGVLVFGYTLTITNGVPVFSNVVDGIGNRTVDGTFDTILGSVLGGTDGIDDLVIKVATLAPNDEYDRIIVAKYADNGTIAWQKAVTVEVGFDCSGADADIDSDGNIYVCGNFSIDSQSPWLSAMIIIKFNSSGVKQWSRRVQGDCSDFGTSIVVGPDNCLYLSAVTGNNDNGTEYSMVVAKYNLDGTVAWQRLLDNTTTWTFAGGSFFGPGGSGSTIAVRTGYVAVVGGFGDPDNTVPHAILAQFDSAGTVFSVGDYDFKAATFTGLLNGSASDITVFNANKTSSDFSGTFDVYDFDPDYDLTSNLVGTLYAGSSGSNELTNGVHVFALESDGTLTLDGDPFTGAGNGFTLLADGTLQANVDGTITTVTSTLTSKPTWLTITPRSPDRDTLDTDYGFNSTGMWFTGNNEETLIEQPAYPIHTTDSFPADVKTVVEFDLNLVSGEEDWGICVYPADGVPHWSWEEHPSRIAATVDCSTEPTVAQAEIHGFYNSNYGDDVSDFNKARFTYDPVAELTTFELLNADNEVTSRAQLPGRLPRDQNYMIGFDADWDEAGPTDKSYFTSLTITSGNTTDAKATELTVTGEVKLPSTTKGFINLQGPWINGDDNIQFQSVAAHNGYAYMIGMAEWAENNRTRIDKYSLTSGELVWTRVLGAGRDAQFDISWTGGTYTIDNIPNSGTGYQAGELLYIAGNQITGGQNPANLVTITVTGINSTGGISTATIAGTAPSGTSSQTGITEFASDGRGDPTSIKYDTVTDTLVVLTVHYTALGDADDNYWDRALVTRINPVSGDVLSTVTLSDEGDIRPYDVAVHPTTGATAVVGEKYNEYRTFGTLTMLAKGVGYFDILKSNLDPEHYPGNDLPNEYASDFWISGTGITNKENVDNANYYQNLTCTTRQGSGATFEIIIDGNGAIEDYVQMLGGANYRVGHKIRLSGTPWEGPDIIVTVAAVQNTTTGAITTITVAFDGAGTGVPGTYTALSGTNIDVGSGLTLNIAVDSVTGSRIANINLGGSNYVTNDVAYISGSAFANGSDGWEILSATTSAYNGEAFFSKSTYPTLNTTLLAVTVGAIAKFENGATARVNVIRDAGDGNWGVTFTTVSGTPPGVASVISFFANDVEVTIVEIGQAGGNVVSAVTAGTTPTNVIRVFVDGVDFTVSGSWTMKQYLGGEAFVWTSAWNKAIGGAINDQFQSVVYSKDGASIYAVGSGQYEVNYRQSLVVKFATIDGSIGFSKYLNSDTENSYATGVATIGTSDIVVAGYEYNTIDNINRDHQFVARLSSSGTVIWKKFYGDGNWENYLDYNSDIQVDSDDNIYVTTQLGADDPNFSNRGFHVTKLDRNGNLLWTRCVSGSDTNYLNNWNGSRFTSLANGQLVVAGYTYVTDDNYYSGLWASFPTDGFTYFGGEGEFVQQGAFRFSQGRITDGVRTLNTGGSFTPSIQAPNITAGNNLKKYATRAPLDLFEQHLHKMVDPKHGGLVFGDGSRQTFATDKIPQIKADRGYTITAQDSGKHIYLKNNSGTITIPAQDSVNPELPVGFTFTIINRTGSDCFVRLYDTEGPTRGTILGAGRNSSYYEWGIPDSGSGSMVTLIKLESLQTTNEGDVTQEPVWMISGPGDIYVTD